MKRMLIITLFFVSSTVFLYACNFENQSGSSTNTLEKIEEQGQLLIGTEGTYPPFTFHNETGELTGFDVEIARAVAEYLDVEPVFIETQWDALFAGLDAGRFDMIANQVGINFEREEKYAFSEPYISSSAVLVIRSDENDIHNFDDIQGRPLAQSLTSNYAGIARLHGADVVGVEGLAQAIQLLHSGRVDATINDKLSILDYINQTGDDELIIIDTYDDYAESGLLFRQDDQALVDAVNVALDEMHGDYTYVEIYQEWFGEEQ